MHNLKTSILLVDDHPIFLKGLRSLLEDETDMTVVGEAGDGQTALDLIQVLSPEIVVMDITMPGLNGIDTTKQILSDYPNTKVIALSIHSENEFVEGMLQAGAVGYIVKESVPEELVKGIRAVMGGESYLSPVITDLVISQFRQGISREPSFQENPVEIIETKLHSPFRPEDHVPRPQLVELFEKNRHLPLQNVTAPAGYGKSTLVGYWLETHDWPNSWISLDEDDNDLQRFLTYLVYAVQTLFPTALSQFREILNAAALPPIHVLAGRLANELNLIEQAFILVLDDFHLIREKKIHDLITELLHYPPQSLHLILVGRSDPFLPLAKFRAQGQLQEIRLHDLRFTREEIVAYMRLITEEPLEDPIIDELIKRTEGWITGLRLAALSMKHEKDFNTIVSKLNGSPEYVMEYLFHEVFSSQPKQIRECLLKIAILDRFCAPLCDAVLGRGGQSNRDELDSWAFIDLLKKENMFILNQDTDNFWFRYHRLFQQFLQHYLKRYQNSDEIAALHGHAAEWFAKEGLPDEAITHALAAGDVPAVARIVEQNRWAVLAADQWQMLGTWLDRLPHEIKQERCELLLGQAWILLKLARLGEITTILQRVEILVDEVLTEPDVLAEICFFQGIVCYFNGKAEQSSELFNNAAKQLSQSPLVVFRAQVECWACLALHLNGQKEDAVQRLNQGIFQKDLHQGMVLSRLRIGLCAIHMLDGEWRQAFAEGLKLMALSRSNHLAFAEAWAMHVLGNASLQMFDLEAAQHYFSQAVKHPYIKHHRATVDDMTGLAMIHQLMGQPAEADETMKQAQAHAQRTKDPGNVEIAHSCSARLALLRGDLGSAARWQGRVNQTAGNQMMLFFLEIPVITECRVLIAIGSQASLEQALEKLEDLHQKTTAWQNTCQMVEIMVLQSLAHHHQGLVDEALTILEAAVTLAMPGNMIRPFVEPGPPMADMLKQLQVRQVSMDFIGNLLAFFSADGPGAVTPMTGPEGWTPVSAIPESSHTLEDPLTKRELEILTLLAQHLYNKEIAEKLYISPETVKTHLKKIYEKLGVDSRRNAVSKAQKLGLVAHQ
ncbi:response regulator [Desulfobacula sp.]|uniref:response regulator n=1 Tax=Desulfobacula sp. TaxID=2593537 RepID=UPI00261AAEB9|nr:response regulator [Desulfobacula sp.]